MGGQMRRSARRLMERTGLIGPYYRWLERRAARTMASTPDARIDDGRPMPPGELVVLVSGPSQRWFSERGRADAGMFAEVARRHRVEMGGGVAVLDLGCGAGRIARWLAPEVIGGGGRYCGSDLNPRLAGWCRANLQGEYLTNGLMPPLAFEAASFDLVFAHSVLTHLTEATATAWLGEVARVLRPGGLALLTYHDEPYAAHWGPPGVADAIAQSPYVVFNQALEGSNYMSAWVRSAHLARLAAAAFEVVEMIPSRADDPAQAIAVLRAKG